MVSRSSKGAVAGGTTDNDSVQRRTSRCARRRHSAIHFLDGLNNLRAPPLMSRRRQLPLELGASQPQGLERLLALRIACRLRPAVGALALHFLEAFLNARLSINQ